MPILSCKSTALFAKLGRRYTEWEFTNLCFDFGIELDEVTSEREMYAREMGDDIDKALLAQKSEEELFKIDLPANRYDLLCLEGLANALLVFLGKRSPPAYKMLPANPVNKVMVKPSILPIRPYVVCAILRDITFTQERYDSFIDLQEKLHANLARKRTLVSIGTHDYDNVQGPFTYEGTPKGDIDFLPLAHAGRGNLKGASIEDYYKQDKHIGRYVPLISKRENFPAIYDSNRTLMSLPPIINSEHSKITLDTKNVFIEVTAIDFSKANIVLNMVISAFSEYCQDQFSIEPVTVEYPEKIDWINNTTQVTPNMGHRTFTVALDYINTSIGINITVDEVCTLLVKMLLIATPTEDKKSVLVKVPCTRADILHECDIMEDVAIAFGYKNILAKCEAPRTLSYGKQQPREALRSLMRTELGLAGYTEMLTFSLCSTDEALKQCRREEPFFGPGIVKIGNPRTVEFQVCRPSLLPGTLKTLNHSKDQPLPLKLFEVTDVVLKDPEHRIGAKYVCGGGGGLNVFFAVHHPFPHHTGTRPTCAPSSALRRRRASPTSTACSSLRCSVLA